MAEDRTAQLISALLDAAQAAVLEGNWRTARGRATDALALDPANQDARTLIAAAEQRLEPLVDATRPGTGPDGLAGRQPSGSGAPSEVLAERASREPDQGRDLSGRYRLGEQIDAGSRETVYRARDVVLDREVAVALVASGPLDPSAREQLLAEARAVARLGEHPNVVPVIDLGRDGERLYIVSAATDGGTLAALIDATHGPLAVHSAVEVATDVGRGLEFAHRQRVVHGDLKPTNVVLGASGEARITGFGLGFHVEHGGSMDRLRILGTPAYMAPEQVIGREVTARSDLYSLGAMLYEMVTGQPPFVGDDGVTLIAQALRATPVNPQLRNSACPPALAALIMRLLAKAPADRPATAAEALDALARIDAGAAAETAAPGVDQLSRGVFVGRRTELERISAMLDGAVAGSGGVVIVSGDSGVGKTRLIAQAEVAARLKGFSVHWGRADESGGAPPLWPWVLVGRSLGASLDSDTLGQLVEEDAAVLQRLWPELSPFVPDSPGTARPDDDSAEQFRLFDAATRFVARVAGRRPVMIIIDDVQWADRASLELFEQLAAAAALARVVLVASYRAGEPADGAQLSDLFDRIGRWERYLPLALTGLSEAEIASYIRESAGLEPRSPLVRAILEHTNGNAFFVQELVALMAEDGALAGDVTPSIQIPTRVREAVGRRLMRLSPEAMHVLELAAVIGRTAHHAVLGQLVDMSEPDLLRAIDELVATRLLDSEADGTYRFAHGLIRDVLLATLTPVRRARRHAQIADELERVNAGHPEQHAALALHLVAAARTDPSYAGRALRYGSRAAADADRQGSWDIAAARYADCLEMSALLKLRGADVATVQAAAMDDVPGEAAMLAAQGRALRNGGAFSAAADTLAAAIHRYEEQGDVIGAAQATVTACFPWQMVPRERRLALTERALDALADQEPHLRAQLLWERAGEDWDEEARSAADEARRLAQAHGFADVEARLLLRDGDDAAASGEPDRACERWRHAIDALLDMGDHESAGQALRNLVITLGFTGRFDECLAECARALGFFRARPSLQRAEEAVRVVLLHVAFAVGDYERTERIAEAVDPRHYNLAAARAGLAELGADFDRAIALAPGPEHPELPPLALPVIHAIRARIYHHAGRTADAAYEFARWQATREQAVGFYRPLAWSELDDALPAFGDDALIAEAATTLAAVPQYRYGLTRGLDRLRATLALARGRLDEAEQHLREGLAWAARERVPIEEGRCLLALVELESRRGHDEQLAGHLERALDLFAMHGAELYLRHAVALKLRLAGVVATQTQASIDLVSSAVISERPDLAPAAAPDGTVTVLFTDIVSSTERNRSMGDAQWLAMLRRHNKIVRASCAAHRGFETKHLGDGFMLAFSSTRSAIRCAVDIQRAFEPNGDDPGAPRVRIGLHTGEVSREGADFFGSNVNFAARVSAAARPAEILASSLARDLVEPTGEFTFEAARVAVFSGVAGEHTVYPVRWRDVEPEAGDADAARSH